MNELGEVVGWTLDGGVQAFIAGPDHPHELLPLPPGYGAAWARGVNDASVVVGSASVGSFPEFGQAVAWRPDGSGGWTIEFLGQLPGHTQSIADDVNNRGDIVGVSILPDFGGGPTVWFKAPGGIVELGTLGGKSFHGSLISASLWTATGGWLSVGQQVNSSAPVQAFDINDAGLAYAELPAPAAYVPGVGVALLTTLVSQAQPAQWSFLTNLGGGLAGASGVPQLSALSSLAPGALVTVVLNHGVAGAVGLPVVGGSAANLPLAGGTLVPSPDLLVPVTVGDNGSHVHSVVWPSGVAAGLSLSLQEWFVDAAGPLGLSATNAIRATTP